MPPQSGADDAIALSTATARAALEDDDITINRDPSHEQSGTDYAHHSGVDVRAVAALPLTHNELTYGVIVLCTSRPDGFDPEEQRLLTDLSESIAFAITVVAQREARQGETVQEAVIQVHDPTHYLVSLVNSPHVTETNATITGYDIGNDSRPDVSASIDTVGRTSVRNFATPGWRRFSDSYVRQYDDNAWGESRLHFRTVSGVSADAIVEQPTNHAGIQSATVLTDGDDAVSMRVPVRPPTLGSLVAEAGGTVQTIRVDDGTVEAVAEFSPRPNMNRVLEHARDVYPDANVASLVTKEPAGVQADPRALGSLTPKTA